MRTIFAEYNPKRNSIDVYTSVGYIYSMSDTIWVEINTIRSCENSEMKFRRRTRSPGSSPAVGSSMTSISGSFNIACAIPTRRFMPPDRLEIFFFFTSESERMSNK